MSWFGFENPEVTKAERYPHISVVALEAQISAPSQSGAAYYQHLSTRRESLVTRPFALVRGRAKLTQRLKAGGPFMQSRQFITILGGTAVGSLTGKREPSHEPERSH